MGISYILPKIGLSAKVGCSHGDLYFDGSLVDGGGRLVASGTEILFETDSATGTSDETTFIGITTEGGTSPTTNRFEIESTASNELRKRIASGGALDDTITGDSGDADQFIDAGAGYDLVPVLRNTFALGVGQSTTYTTQTIFGSGAPEQVIIPPPSPPDPTEIPFEFSPSLGILMLGAWAAIGMLKTKVQKRKVLEVVSVKTSDGQPESV